jgi:hypothetical protein
MSKTEEIIELRRANPGWTLTRIATQVGVSRQAVHQALKVAGLPTIRDIVRERVEGRYGGVHVNVAEAGAIGELQVVCDLMRHGLMVYRALHPHSAVDLIALVNKTKPVRIEVRSGSRPKTLALFSVNRPPKDRRHLYDVLAIPFPDGEVIYEPPIDEWGVKP